MKKIKCNVIVCGPAVGKTYLSSIDDRFIDLDEIKATYKYGLQNATDYEKENGKLQRGKIINDNSAEYAIVLLEKETKNNKMVLLSYSKKIMSYINEKKIPYCLVYPNYTLRKEYSLRMKNRGNNNKFIFEMTNKKAWKQFFSENNIDEKPTYKIQLEKGQYLSDIKNLFFD